MPPGGQSVGLAFEDAIILSRLLSSSPSADLADVFARYDSVRRPRVEDHYKQMAARWEGTKTHSWWVQWIREFFVWVYLRAIARHADESFGYDPMKVSL
jgi:2-polyprenyl-6-methoxyphenol hydroxylase-like FAD-dependent oxidoreductase